MLRALDVAKYFIYKAGEDEDLISNLKLQKLVYYAQGIHLALYRKPLFNDPIEAWDYGPVVPSLYKKYKQYSSNGIPPKDFDIENIDKKTRVFLDEIYTAFGQFSATRLIDYTHSDQCWKDAHQTKSIITQKSMQECLKKYLNVEKS